MKDRIVWLTIMVMCLTAAAVQAQGFGVPAGGWFYIQEFDTDAATMEAEGWYRDNDSWDGSVPGEAGTAPGGLAWLTEAGPQGPVTYLRVQDTGRPSENGWSDPSNRKMKFWLDLEDVGMSSAVGDTLLDDGVTYSFRARIATTGILDPRYYHDNNPPAGHVSGEPWLTPPMQDGEGHQIHNRGNGMFGIHQALPVYGSNDNGGLISFSLFTDPDTDRNDWLNDGIATNSDVGTSPHNSPDSGDGIQNASAAFDVTEWHEFWITIEAGGAATHVVNIYMDGGTTPSETFDVTIGRNDSSGNKGAYINIGSTNSDEAAAWDTDFLAVSPGVIAPVPGDPNFNPAPTCSAGPDQSGYYPDGNPFTLAGSADDAGPLNPLADGAPGGIISSVWSVKSTPPGGTALFVPVDTNLVYDPEVTFNMPGVYVLEFTVYDGNSVPQDANDLVVITLRDHADDFLVGHWAFEDNLDDSTANANHGTGYGLSGDMAAHELAGDRAELKASTFSTDTPFVASSHSLLLVNPDNDEPNEYVCVGDAPQLDDMSVPSEFTVTAWVKTFEDQAGQGPRVIMSKGGDGPSGVRWMLKTNNGNARIITDDNSNKQTATGGAIDDGLWHFVVGTVKLDEIAIYVDGVQTDDDTGMGPNYDLSGTSQRQAFIGAATRYQWPTPTEPNYPDHPGDEDLWIPATEPNQFNVDSPGDGFAYDAKVWNGLLDEIKVYNYALPLDDSNFSTDILRLAAEGALPADVDAGPSKTVELQRPIILETEGTVEDYGLPGALIYAWTTVSRPPLADSNAVFDNDAALVGNVEFTEFGEWVLQVTVFDVDLGIITDTSTVTLTLVSPTCDDVMAAELGLVCDISGPEGVPDCRCDLYDVAAFAADFGRCNDPQAPGCEDPWL